MRRSEYDICAQEMDSYEDTLFEKLAHDEITEWQYHRLATKLDEWKAQLIRKAPKPKRVSQ